MKNAIKNIMILILTALAACSMLIACANPMSSEEGAIGNGDGLITVTIGGTNARKIVNWANTLDIDALAHTITFSGGPGTAPPPQTIPPGGGKASFTVIPGEWTIKAEGKLPSGDLVAVGSETIQINQGKNDTVMIQMQEPPNYNSYTVTFNANGGSPNSTETVKKYSKATRPEPPVRSGYGFVDWFTESACINKYNFATAVTGPVTLYAGWSDTFYTVTFIDNGITVDTQDIGEHGRASAPTSVAKVGYSGGWYKESTFKTLWDFDNNTVTAPISLYVKWIANTYYVDFNVNGGYGSMNNQQFTYGTAQNLTANAFAKTGYTFAGWATSAGGAKAYNDGESVINLTATAHDTVTLYAVWTINNYTVNYNTDGGTPATIAAKTGVKWSDTNLLPASNPTKAGFTFAGWNVTAGGSGTNVSNNAAYGSLATNDSITSITLTAQWTAKTYTVNYNTDGGTPATIAAKTSVKWGDANLLPASNPTKAGFTFAGWNVTAGGSGEYVSVSTPFSELATNDSVTSITLTAQWSTGTYTVNYNTNGGTPETITARTGVKWSDTNLLPASNPTKLGSTFAGWDVTAGGSVTNVTNSMAYSSLATNDSVMSITLQARWIAKTYTVNYNTDGGKPETITAKDVKWNDTNLLPPGNSPTKAGYTFGGWNVTDGGSVTNVTNSMAYSSLATNDSAMSITLTAQWTTNSYTVTFDKNTTDATAWPTPESKSVTYDAAYGALATISRDGYTFDGWYTAITGGMKVTDTTIVTNAGDNTLYAHWTAKTYTVNYNTDGGTPATIDAKTGVLWSGTNLLPPSNPTKAGFNFAGWKLTDGGSPLWNVSNNIAFSGLATNDSVTSITLTAQWTSTSTTGGFEVGLTWEDE